MEIRKILENIDDASSEKILKELSTDVYVGEIFVQTPKGKVIKLIENATPLDFAYEIHTNIGKHAQYAKINGRLSSVKTILQQSQVR